MLTVSLLVCAMMALATADDVASSNSTSNVSNNSSSNADDASSYEAGPACPASWMKYNDRCFLYVPRELDWSDAEKNCQSFKGNLASVHSIEEYHFIQMIIKQQTHGYPMTWIGGHDSPKNNVWFWSDGRPFYFTFWCAGQPNNSGGNQGCIRMNAGEHNCWDDFMCSGKLPSVCARNPEESPELTQR
ncbi:type-2 ice-structuring protein-like isoform X2 [Perca fluviatilis]|uniref:type-2 ice-structuring protein-like isoform X2 n=1 Tax=Perca fluviatilis TaxID=8168 RepID=UPI001963B731|nr:type-2 ice-structuring protein-like isoform X2 [Perca fluviatilis]